MLNRSNVFAVLLSATAVVCFAIIGCSADEDPETLPMEQSAPAQNTSDVTPGKGEMPTIAEEMATVPEVTPTGWKPYDEVYQGLEQMHTGLTSGESIQDMYPRMLADAKALAADKNPQHELTAEMRKNFVIEIQRYFDEAPEMSQFDRIIRFEPVLMLAGEIAQNTEPPAHSQLNRLEAMKNTLHRASEQYRPGGEQGDGHGGTVIPPDVVPGVQPAVPGMP